MYSSNFQCIRDGRTYKSSFHKSDVYFGVFKYSHTMKMVRFFLIPLVVETLQPFSISISTLN